MRVGTIFRKNRCNSKFKNLIYQLQRSISNHTQKAIKHKYEVLKQYIFFEISFVQC